MSYASITNFGPSVEDSAVNNPLTYCMTTNLDNSFVHTAGKRKGNDSKSCQMFMSDYCANKWDNVCEYASQNTDSYYPNGISSCMKNIKGACIATGLGNQFTQGDILVRNTAAKKYLTQMSANCELKYEPFDPLVASSPMIRYFEPSCNSGCVPVYEVDPNQIDHDPVMNKILQNPLIAMDILINIYNTAKRLGKFDALKNTKLYRFFITAPFQQYVTVAQIKANKLAGTASPNPTQ